jgi:hypothetical protein
MRIINILFKVFKVVNKFKQIKNEVSTNYQAYHINHFFLPARYNSER